MSLSRHSGDPSLPNDAGTKKDWALFSTDVLAVIFTLLVYAVGLINKPQFRLLLCYAFVAMAAWIPVLIVCWRMVDRMMGKWSWFEFENGSWGTGIKHCEHGRCIHNTGVVGEGSENTCGRIFVASKIFFFFSLLNIMDCLAVGFLLGIEMRSEARQTNK